MSHLITGVPGSSAYFVGSIISYSNEVKQNILGVTAATLAQFGLAIERFGPTAILVRAVPAVLGHGDPQALLRVVDCVALTPLRLRLPEMICVTARAV